MTCNDDIDYNLKEADAQEAKPFVVVTSAVQGGGFRRAHMMVKDAYIIDQESQLSVHLTNGQRSRISLGFLATEAYVGDMCCINGKQDLFAILVKDKQPGTSLGCVAVYSLNKPEGSAELKFKIMMPQTEAKKIEAHCDKKNTKLAVLNSDGSIFDINVTAAIEAGKTEMTSKEAMLHCVLMKVELNLTPTDFSLSSDGKVFVGVGEGNSLVTLDASDLSKLCTWKHEGSDITAVRILPAMHDDRVIKSHVVLVWSGAKSTVTIYLIKPKEKVWRAWKKQQITLSNIDASDLFCVSAKGDIAVVSSKSKSQIVVMRLSVPTEDGQLVKTINHYNCGDDLGHVVSLEAYSDTKGVRISARHTEGLALHDIAYSGMCMPKEHFSSQTAAFDQLTARVKELERENEQLKNENQALQSKSTVEKIPPEFEEQLKETTEAVSITCKKMLECHKDLVERLNRLETEVAESHKLQNHYNHMAEQELVKTNQQALAIIAESSNQEQEKLKEIQTTTSTELRKVADESVNEYNKLTEKVHKQRLTEVREMEEKLKRTIQSLLSEPGLLRLKEQVAAGVFHPKVSDSEQDALKDALQSTLNSEIKRQLEGTVNVILDHERETLMTLTRDMITKADTVISKLPDNATAELKTGLSQYFDSSQIDEKWQAQAENRLNELLTESRSVLTGMGKQASW